MITFLFWFFVINTLIGLPFALLFTEKQIRDFFGLDLPPWRLL